MKINAKLTKTQYINTKRQQGNNHVPHRLWKSVTLLHCVNYEKLMKILKEHIIDDKPVNNIKSVPEPE